MSAPRLLDVDALPGRLALTPAEAAAALGCSRTFLEEQVLPDLRVVRRGRRIFVPVSELVRWLEREGEAVAETIGARR
ncbi:helix-turn-helix domain-containing protein [Miltoncostaea marina]|uniref:helix-turn-helix domain-containing protein n=1 Tax=Miltoncostaea marina TaxID=2843215 RepID=UPI001C3E873F|nr:helix-turn-helix domain-containing protein [Miltoncostaea marina]